MYNTHMVNVTGGKKRCTHFVMFISHSFFLVHLPPALLKIAGAAFPSLCSRSSKS
jgi:hypothetical protein